MDEIKQIPEEEKDAIPQYIRDKLAQTQQIIKNGELQMDYTTQVVEGIVDSIKSNKTANIEQIRERARANIIKRIYKEEDSISIKTTTSRQQKSNFQNKMLMYQNYKPFSSLLLSQTGQLGLDDIRAWKKSNNDLMAAEKIIFKKFNEGNKKLQNRQEEVDIVLGMMQASSDNERKSIAQQIRGRHLAGIAVILGWLMKDRIPSAIEVVKLLKDSNIIDQVEAAGKYVSDEVQKVVTDVKEKGQEMINTAIDYGNDSLENIAKRVGLIEEPYNYDLLHNFEFKMMVVEQFFKDLEANQTMSQNLTVADKANAETRDLLFQNVEQQVYINGTQSKAEKALRAQLQENDYSFDYMNVAKIRKADLPAIDKAFGPAKHDAKEMIKMAYVSGVITKPEMENIMKHVNSNYGVPIQYTEPSHESDLIFKELGEGMNYYTDFVNGTQQLTDKVDSLLGEVTGGRLAVNLLSQAMGNLPAQYIDNVLVPISPLTFTQKMLGSADPLTRWGIDADTNPQVYISQYRFATLLSFLAASVGIRGVQLITAAIRAPPTKILSKVTNQMGGLYSKGAGFGMLGLGAAAIIGTAQSALKVQATGNLIGTAAEALGMASTAGMLGVGALIGKKVLGAITNPSESIANAKPVFDASKLAWGGMDKLVNIFVGIDLAIGQKIEDFNKTDTILQTFQTMMIQGGLSLAQMPFKLIQHTIKKIIERKGQATIAEALGVIANAQVEEEVQQHYQGRRKKEKANLTVPEGGWIKPNTM